MRPERRLEDWRCRRLQRGRSAHATGELQTRRPLEWRQHARQAHRSWRPVRPRHCGRTVRAASEVEPPRDQRPSRLDHLLGGVVRARLRSRWAAAGSVIAGELHRSPWNWPLCRPRRWCAPSRVGAREGAGEPVLQAGRRRPHESTWMSSYGRYGGASPPAPSGRRGRARGVSVGLRVAERYPRPPLPGRRRAQSGTRDRSASRHRPPRGSSANAKRKRCSSVMPSCRCLLSIRS